MVQWRRPRWTAVTVTIAVLCGIAWLVGVSGSVRLAFPRARRRTRARCCVRRFSRRSARPRLRARAAFDVQLRRRGPSPLQHGQRVRVPRAARGPRGRGLACRTRSRRRSAGSGACAVPGHAHVPGERRRPVPSGAGDLGDESAYQPDDESSLRYAARMGAYVVQILYEAAEPIGIPATRDAAHTALQEVLSRL